MMLLFMQRRLGVILEIDISLSILLAVKNSQDFCWWFLPESSLRRVFPSKYLTSYSDSFFKLIHCVVRDAKILLLVQSPPKVGSYSPWGTCQIFHQVPLSKIPPLLFNSFVSVLLLDFFNYYYYYFIIIGSATQLVRS